MPTTNLYFNNFAFTQEQTLIENLVIESIRIYGIDVFYLPRTLVAEDNLFGEDVLSKFENAYQIEMYIKSVDGFQGDGDFLSKFGLEIRDEMVLTVARRRFGEEISIEGTTPVDEADGVARPAEGDLVYFPLNGKIFEVKFVEHEAIFYQMGSLQTYDITLELFEYSHEVIDTGIADIDAIEDNYSGVKQNLELLDEASDRLVFENGFAIIQEEYKIETTDNQANNEFFQAASNISFIDFTEVNPFSEGGSW
tara:strand:+ start:2291 stop:3046 length:756 start_codon:yes stop_codon:yes gene_type:complete